MLEKLVGNFELTTLIFSFIEDDPSLFSSICVNRGCELNLSINTLLWSMITHRVSCAICFLEAKSSMPCYVTSDVDKVINLYWKEICKTKLAHKRIQRQWRLYGAQRVMVRASHRSNLLSSIGGCNSCPMDHRNGNKNYVCYTKTRKLSACKIPKSVSSKNWTAFIRKVKEFIGQKMNVPRAQIDEPRPCSQVCSVMNEHDKLPNQAKEVPLSSVHKLLDAFLELESNVLLSESPLPHHSHDLSTIPPDWIDTAKSCSFCQINTSAIEAPKKLKRTRTWKEVAVHPTNTYNVISFKDPNDARTFFPAAEGTSPGQKSEIKACLEDMHLSIGGSSRLLSPGGVQWFVTHCCLVNGDSTYGQVPREVLVAVSFSLRGDAARVCAVTSTKTGFRWV